MKKHVKIIVSACVFAAIACFTSTGLAIDMNRVPQIQKPAQLVTWYYVSGAGKTEGPVSENELQQLYRNNRISDGTYLWNGTTVTQWTPLSQLPNLLRQLKYPKIKLFNR